MPAPRVKKPIASTGSKIPKFSASSENKVRRKDKHYVCEGSRPSRSCSVRGTQNRSSCPLPSPYTKIKAPLIYNPMCGLMRMLWRKCKFPESECMWLFLSWFHLLLLCRCRKRPPRWRGPPPLPKPPPRRERPSLTSPMWVLSVQLHNDSIWCIERPLWAWLIAICKNIWILCHWLPHKVVINQTLQGWAHCDSRRWGPLVPATRYSNNAQSVLEYALKFKHI